MPELEDLRASIADIQAAIVQLDWYKRVNHEALHRVRQKQQVAAGAQPPLGPSAAEAAKLWDSKFLSRLNQLQGTVCAALADGGPTPITRQISLLARQLLHSRGLYIPEAARQAIAVDDPVALGEVLRQRHNGDSGDDNQALLRGALLRLAALYRSTGCYAFLYTLSTVPCPAVKDTNGKEDTDSLHNLVLQVGRHHIGDPSERLNQILGTLPENEQWVLSNADALGRLPLHYAAALDLATLCSEMLASMAQWGWSALRRSQILFTCDAAGETPLDLAVRLGHVSALRPLLKEVLENVKEDPAATALLEQPVGGRASLGRLLFIAIQSGYEDVFSTLLLAGLDLHCYRNDNGETATYVAARHGRVAMVRSLLLAGADPDQPEMVRGWTPLMIAAIQGHHEVLEVLVHAAVNQGARDHDRGWTALDHAAYKGYPAMMKVLRRESRCDPLPTNAAFSTENPRPRLAANNLPASTSIPRPSHPQSYVFVHPGTLDVYDKVAVVDIGPYRADISPAVVPDTSLFLEISSLEPLEQQSQPPAAPCVFQLPLLDDWSNRPWGFPTHDVSSAKVIFRLFSALETNGPIGTAVALLSSLRSVLGPGRESLIRHHTIPFVGPRGNLVGTVTFTFMIARAPESQQRSTTTPQRLGHPNSTLIGAHRGTLSDSTSSGLILSLTLSPFCRPRAKRQAAYPFAAGREYASGTYLSHTLLPCRVMSVHSR